MTPRTSSRRPYRLSYRSVLRALAIGGMVVGLATACGGSGSKPAAASDAPDVVQLPTTLGEGTALTVGEANTLSRLLFQNYQTGGADFVAKVPYGVRSTIEITGSMDWKNHRGQGELRVIATDGSVVDSSKLFWGDLYNPQQGYIVSTLAGLNEAMAESGRADVNYVVRPFTESSPLDRVLRYLDGLATTQAENPLLMRQDAKAKSLGAQQIELNRKQVDTTVLRYGQSVYWADKAGRMVQVSAPLAGLDQPTVFSFSDPRSVSVVIPPNSEVVQAADIPQIYEKLTKRE
jgi:hypothetical protein